MPRRFISFRSSYFAITLIRRAWLTFRHFLPPFRRHCRHFAAAIIISLMPPLLRCHLFSSMFIFRQMRHVASMSLRHTRPAMPLLLRLRAAIFDAMFFAAIIIAATTALARDAAEAPGDAVICRWRHFAFSRHTVFERHAAAYYFVPAICHVPGAASAAERCSFLFFAALLPFATPPPRR
jgi:hypothetical protein